MIDEAGLADSVDLEVDGGIGPSTIAGAAAAGANVLIAGSALYRDPEGLAHAVADLRARPRPLDPPEQVVPWPGRLDNRPQRAGGTCPTCGGRSGRPTRSGPRSRGAGSRRRSRSSRSRGSTAALRRRPDRTSNPSASAPTPCRCQSGCVASSWRYQCGSAGVCVGEAGAMMGNDPFDASTSGGNGPSGEPHRNRCPAARRNPHRDAGSCRRCTTPRRGPANRRTHHGAPRHREPGRSSSSGWSQRITGSSTNARTAVTRQSQLVDRCRRPNRHALPAGSVTRLDVSCVVGRRRRAHHAPGGRSARPTATKPSSVNPTSMPRLMLTQSRAST